MYRFNSKEKQKSKFILKEETTSSSSGQYISPMAFERGGELTSRPDHVKNMFGVEIMSELPQEVNITDMSFDEVIEDILTDDLEGVEVEYELELDDETPTVMKRQDDIVPKLADIFGL